MTPPAAPEGGTSTTGDLYERATAMRGPLYRFIANLSEGTLSPESAQLIADEAVARILELEDPK